MFFIKFNLTANSDIKIQNPIIFLIQTKILIHWQIVHNFHQIQISFFFQFSLQSLPKSLVFLHFSTNKFIFSSSQCAIQMPFSNKQLIFSICKNSRTNDLIYLIIFGFFQKKIKPFNVLIWRCFLRIRIFNPQIWFITTKPIHAVIVTNFGKFWV